MATSRSEATPRRPRVAATRILVGALVATGLLATTPIGHFDQASEAATAVRRIDIPTAGPSGPVTVIGDSVLLGAAVTNPTLPEQLAARGWGPIRFRASGSASSGLFDVPDDFRSSFWIDRWQGEGWDPRHVIVNLGVNDSGLCSASVACAYDSIMHMVDAIGPGHEIWWPNIVKPIASHQLSFNSALRRVEAERSDFHVWDWNAEYVNGGYRSSDGVHLDPEGYRRRSDAMAQAFTDELARAQRTGGDVALPTPTAPAGTFVTMPPRRLADTRADPGASVAGGTRLAIDIDGAVAQDATAAALYVTAARPSASGYLSAGPCDEPTEGSTVNFTVGAARGAPTITAVGSSGTVCIFASVDTDVVVDLQGVFVADGSGSPMTPLTTPRRLHDTRATGRSQTVVVDVGSPVDAVAVNIGAARADGVGFLSATSCAAPELAANVNYAPGPARSSSAIVPVDDDGTFCVAASSSVDVIVDLTAVFSADGTLGYVPVAPTRTLDTRSGTGGWHGRLGAGQTVDVGVVPPDAAAVTGTLSVVRPDPSGFASANACPGTSETAAVNAGGGEIVANSLTSAVSDGRLCVTSSARAEVLFDTNGWWVPV